VSLGCSPVFLPPLLLCFLFFLLAVADPLLEYEIVAIGRRSMHVNVAVMRRYR
jgi:hypothetical protein